MLTLGLPRISAAAFLVCSGAVMLDYFAIFTKGALLWTLQFTAALKQNPIDALNEPTHQDLPA